MSKLVTLKLDVNIYANSENEKKCADNCEFLQIKDGWGRCVLFHQELKTDVVDYNRCSSCVNNQ